MEKEIVIKQFDMHDIIIKQSSHEIGTYIHTTQSNKDGVLETQVIEQKYLQEYITALKQFLPKEEGK